MCWMRLWAEGHLTQNCFVCFYFYVDQFYVVVKRRIFLKEIKLGKSIILSNVKDHCANDVELPECSDSTWRAKCVCVCVRGFVIDLCTVLDAYVLLKAANLSLPSSTLLKTFSPQSDVETTLSLRSLRTVRMWENIYETFKHTKMAVIVQCLVWNQVMLQNICTDILSVLMFSLLFFSLTLRHMIRWWKLLFKKCDYYFF